MNRSFLAPIFALLLVGCGGGSESIVLDTEPGLDAAIETVEDQSTQVEAGTEVPVDPFCGDGECLDDESCLECPEDCGACIGCGDDNCDPDFGEDCAACPEDCGDCCGDGDCVDGEEDCDSCPEDCGDCVVCGDDACTDDEEDCDSCPEDCGDCIVCGDDTCTDDEEDCDSCPEDCGDCVVCGDDTCTEGEEDCDSCPDDCGECCGNDTCDVDFGEDCFVCPEDCGDCCEANEICDVDYDENCFNCPEDCGECCGDGECVTDHAEDCAVCPEDCGICCGNGDCDAVVGETCASCPEDCGECPPECGDGILDLLLEEECDDGNLGVGDGCDGFCKVEPMAAEAGDIVISEVMKNPEAVLDAEGEWVELYNDTNGDINLNAWILKDKDADSHRIFSYDGVNIEANSYLVLGLSADVNVNGGVDVGYVYDEFLLSNTADEVVLMSGSTIIDEVTYDQDEFPNAAGHSLSLSAELMTAAENDSAESWCAATDVYGGGDYGTPGQVNPICTDPVVCGDGVCVEGEEDCSNCQADCGGCCGDDVCDAGIGEDCATCPADCDKCCGDGFCEETLDENCFNCPVDCDPCCPNFQCDVEFGEDCNNCLVDCGVCPADCGNGEVEPGEPCDDGNTESGDGCSEVCLLEFGQELAPGMLIITEIMKDPKMAGDIAGEWFEVVNISTEQLTLNGWKISDLGGDEHVIQSNSDLLVEPGEIFVLGNNSDFNANGGVVVGYEFAGFTLGNGGDEVILTLPDGTVMDAVHYTNDEFPDIPGRALSLEPTAFDHEANDDPANWCSSAGMMANGDSGSPGFVNPTCAASAECGNGKAEWGEECDDGNVVGCDGCDSQCVLEFPPICGNGVKETCEECDDGNLEEGDGCSPTCESEVQAICGNGVKEPGEECDDGCQAGDPMSCDEFIDDGDGCDYLCQAEGVCGNGVLEPGEQCDDGNNTDDDGCGALCDFEFDDPYCGDGKVEGTEQCDDGCLKGFPNVCEPEFDDDDGCSWECIMEGFKPLVCGNGVVEPLNDEECDDGNIINGDGCNDSCKKIGSGLCSPSPCCGDGNHDDGEECDDGNLEDDDGCSSACIMDQAPTAITGTITFDGEAGPNDTVWVLAYDELLESPGGEGVSPAAVEIFDAIFPLEYVLPATAGTWYVGAVYDVNGDAAQGFGLEDFGVWHVVNDLPATVTIKTDEIVEGINILIVKPDPCLSDDDCPEDAACDEGVCVPGGGPPGN